MCKLKLFGLRIHPPPLPLGTNPIELAARALPRGLDALIRHSFFLIYLEIFLFYSRLPNNYLYLMQFLGCWDDNLKACYNTHCVSDSPSSLRKNHRFCCCTGNMCNQNTTIYETLEVYVFAIFIIHLFPIKRHHIFRKSIEPIN